MKLYVEGGGDSKTLKAACRRGFSKFIEKAGLAGLMPSIVACGSRGNTYRNFRTAHANQREPAMLLVDAEGPVTASGAWQHLKQRDVWSRPHGATDSQCHLMVQAMESWFLADRDALAGFYGPGYQANALPSKQKLEQIHKQDVIDGLKQAAGNTSKGSYNKGAHSYEILATLDPAKVSKASRHAKRLIRALSGQGD